MKEKKGEWATPSVLLVYRDSKGMVYVAAITIYKYNSRSARFKMA